MTKQVIIDQLKEHEGLRLKPYYCSAGRLTIGYGHSLDDKGITEKEAMYLLKQDIQACVYDLNRIFGTHFGTIPEIAQRVLIDMRFNLGPSRFRKFKKLIAAIRVNDFKKAKLEMIDSLWYKQVGGRSKTLVEMMDKCT
jgi:lysozyme